MKRVIGIGNALTDFLVNLRNDDFLNDFNFGKGSMNLVDSYTQRGIQAATAELPHTLSLGGSAANTIRAMACMGIPVGYIGKVGRDSTGNFFEAALDNLKIEPFIFYGHDRSGRCVSLVSSDGERTMITFLGASLEMTTGDITSDIFDNYDCLYVEGFQVQNREVIEHAMKTAKNRGLKIALDLASYNVVNENQEFLRGLVRNYVDIVFSNEAEAEAFTDEAEPVNALEAISKICEIAVVKIGTRGAYIKCNGEVIHVGIMAAAQRVDTTGAGDFYAAGFLAGMCEGLSLRQCGTIGAIAAGKVIEVIGTTFGDEVWKEVNMLINSVKTEKYLF